MVRCGRARARPRSGSCGRPRLWRRCRVRAGGGRRRRVGAKGSAAATRAGRPRPPPSAAAASRPSRAGRSATTHPTGGRAARGPSSRPAAMPSRSARRRRPCTRSSARAAARHRGSSRAAAPLVLPCERPQDRVELRDTLVEVVDRLQRLRTDSRQTSGTPCRSSSTSPSAVRSRLIETRTPHWVRIPKIRFLPDVRNLTRCIRRSSCSSSARSANGGTHTGWHKIAAGELGEHPRVDLVGLRRQRRQRPRPPRVRDLDLPTRGLERLSDPGSAAHHLDRRRSPPPAARDQPQHAVQVSRHDTLADHLALAFSAHHARASSPNRSRRTPPRLLPIESASTRRFSEADRRTPLVHGIRNASPAISSSYVFRPSARSSSRTFRRSSFSP